ncbi:MAG: hypothetical protein A3A29_00825 [Candidatus Ryanbacteria bacterium RIFCSPLOWO2_01_FULL_47_79]|uniref:YggU family protein n=1 Tax=Candidatus Giovannonibacteria bacterium GW2011_GWA2_44_26 TaxID=1618648 RepID=A0A0G1IUL9_9BACT|nr:MAG: hypothetical protein UW55_C0010G0002 [Candidatus Giovannonibacteria bacterium GW2011_GWA2_44_26]OGZ52290.1 MAG: hypothetical protein A3A29_00825 [Candidatus Ryanbacteria bacterium RIFCSPLOWO2_01_FULL_47_79]
MLIRMKVKAGARKERIVEIGPGRFEIEVKEKATQNAANGRVVALIARHLRVPEKSLHMVSGHHHPRKTLRVI